MLSAKLFIHKQQMAEWQVLVVELEEQGIGIYRDVSPAGKSIVLGGQYINPLVLTGEKVLISYSPEWGALFKHVFYPVLLEYYDRIIDITGKKVPEIIRIIKRELCLEK